LWVNIENIPVTTGTKRRMLFRTKSGIQVP